MSGQDFRQILGTDLVLNTTNQDQDGTALDLSGAGAALLTVKSAIDDPDGSAILSIAGTGLTAGGAAVFTIALADIDSKTPQRYVYNIRVKTTAGKWHQTFDGEYVIEEAVSERTS